MLRLLVVILGLSTACAREPMPVPSRPSVVLVSLDTVRADHLSAYGYARETSPFLEDLGRRCVVFDRAIAQSASTVPSHRAMMASRYAWHVRPEDPYLAERLAAEGYATAAFTGSGGVSAELGFSRGFASWFEATHHQRTFDEVLPRIERWLATRDRSVPTFLFVHSYDPHHPYDPPEPYASMFFPEYQGPVTGPGTHQLLSKLARVPPNHDYRGYIPLTAADREKIVALYDGQLRYVDDRLRDLFALLERDGLLRESIVFVTSDHGEEFWEHGGVLHSHTVHQELLHVPFVACAPREMAWRPRRERQIVRHVDLVPTVLDFVRTANTAVPMGVQGVSLRPVLERGEKLGLPGVAELNWFKTIQDERWKLMVDQRDRRLLLYDLERDPLEQEDLFPREPHLALGLYRRLAAELGQGMNETVSALNEAEVDSLRLREQLRALGYIQ